MSHPQLHAQIEALHAAIDAIPTTDTGARARVQALLDDLSRQLDQPDDQHRASLLEALPGQVRHFEAEHPQITEILRRAMAALSEAGI